MQDNNLKIKKGNRKNIKGELRFLLFRVITIILVIVTITALKYALPNVFNELKTYYDTVFSVDINPNNILNESENMTNA